LITATQRNTVTKSGRDGRIVWGEIVLGAQLEICMSGSESSALMLSRFLFAVLFIDLGEAARRLGRKEALSQGKGPLEGKALQNPATRSQCFTSAQNLKVVKKYIISLGLVVDLTQMASCHSTKRIGENLPNLASWNQTAPEEVGRI
jgi:hypothetical protein